jgi:hypothetical protein
MRNAVEQPEWWIDNTAKGLAGHEQENHCKLALPASDE